MISTTWISRCASLVALMLVATAAAAQSSAWAPAKAVELLVGVSPGGVLAAVPTWSEQGVEAVVANWRPVIGAKGWSPAQLSYWEDVFLKMVSTDEWKGEIARAGGVPHFMGSRDLSAYFDAEYIRFRAILTDLGLAK